MGERVLQCFNVCIPLVSSRGEGEPQARRRDCALVVHAQRLRHTLLRLWAACDGPGGRVLRDRELRLSCRSSERIQAAVGRAP